MNLRENLATAAARVKSARRVVVLTGAGISAESGIPTFRDAQTGLWAQYNPAELASPDGFRNNPKLVWEWYEYRREVARNSQPNPAHYALAKLETLCPEFVIVTQNVDELHTRAGSHKVLELHGRIFENRCFKDHRLITDAELDRTSVPPRCPCGAYARPGVVWFGESIPEAELAAAFKAARQCDVCLVIGTSGVVHPAASIPPTARHSGAFVIEINNQPSALTDIAQIFLCSNAGEALPELIKLLEA